MRAECVRDDEAGVLRKDITRHLDGGREEQPVAMETIVHPFLVGAEVLDRGLDLDDPDIARAVQRYQVSAPARGQREFGDRREPKLMQQARRAARNAERGRRLASVNRESL